MNVTSIDLPKVCRSGMVNEPQQQIQTEEEEAYCIQRIYLVENMSKHKSLYVYPRVNIKVVKMELDTGSAYYIISRVDLNKPFLWLFNIPFLFFIKYIITSSVLIDTLLWILFSVKLQRAGKTDMIKVYADH